MSCVGTMAEERFNQNCIESKIFIFQITMHLYLSLQVKYVKKAVFFAWWLGTKNVSYQIWPSHKEHKYIF